MAVAEPPPGLIALAELTRRVVGCPEPDAALDVAMTSLEELFAITHVMLLSFDEGTQSLVVVAMHGYQDGGIGREVVVTPGEGALGIAVSRGRPVRIGNLQRLLLYGRTVRREHLQGGARAGPELALPGLADAQSQLAVPLSHQGQVTGVLSSESTEVAAFGPADEAVMEVVAALVANSLELERLGDEQPVTAAPSPPQRHAGRAGVDRGIDPPAEGPAVVVRHYLGDGSTFLTDEYLVKGVPGRLLWKLLNEAIHDGRTDFTNREVRLDPALQLPAFKDNFESRLILLRRRLDERQTPFRITKTGRGRFRFDLQGHVQLVAVEDA